MPVREVQDLKPYLISCENSHVSALPRVMNPAHSDSIKVCTPTTVIPVSEKYIRVWMIFIILAGSGYFYIVHSTMWLYFVDSHHAFDVDSGNTCLSKRPCFIKHKTSDLKHVYCITLEKWHISFWKRHQKFTTKKLRSYFIQLWIVILGLIPI